MSSEDPVAGIQNTEEDGDGRYSPEMLATAPKAKKMFAYDWSTGYVSPYRPTEDGQMDQLFDSMERLRIISPGNSPANEKLSFWDLGCGDGRVVVQACKRYSVQGIGIELDESLIKIAKELAQEAGVENNVDFRTTDLLLLSNPSDLQPQPDIIFIYLLPTALQRIQGLLERIMDELNTTVIIHLWPIVEWKSTRLVHVESDRFFVYQKPQQ